MLPSIMEPSLRRLTAQVLRAATAKAYPVCSSTCRASASKLTTGPAASTTNLAGIARQPGTLILCQYYANRAPLVWQNDRCPWRQRRPGAISPVSPLRPSSARQVGALETLALHAHRFADASPP